MSRDGWVALPRGAMGLSAVCNCGISLSYSLTIFFYVRHVRYTTDNNFRTLCTKIVSQE